MTTGNESNPKLSLSTRTYSRALDCIQCGLCLPGCPTYTQSGLETDSPRGRIRLIKAAADGRIELADPAAQHLDLCLDCRSCETACPSGVVYHELIEAARVHLDAGRPRRWSDQIVEWFFYRVFAFPKRLRAALFPVRLLQRVGLWRAALWLGEKLLPDRLAKMAQMLPKQGMLWPRSPAQRHAPQGAHQMTVGYFTGCIGSVIQPRVQRCTIELLQYLGCEVVAPRTQCCCGAIHHHGGRLDPARAMARQNIDAFEGLDAVVTDIAGCGAMLKEYARLLDDDDRALRFAERVCDISQLLETLRLPIPKHPVAMHATYHDACHLVHGQGITAAPRRLLRMIDGLKLMEMCESDICCGSAGTYNLTQPDMSRKLAERKLAHIRETGCGVCITANVGCAMQIESVARQAKMKLQVLHPVELLHRAYLGSHD